MQTWAAQNRVELRFIQPDKPVENAYIESLNGKLRDEYLSVGWFRSRAEAKVVIEAWRLAIQRYPTPQQLELLDATRVQAAASPHPQPSRPPGICRGRSSYKDAKDYQKR